MKKYKGYYIDGIYFHNEKEIDDCRKKQAVEAYKNTVKIFASRHTMEASIFCDEHAQKLHEQYGFSWEEIEALEFEAYDERKKELEKFDEEHPNLYQLTNNMKSSIGNKLEKLSTKDLIEQFDITENIEYSFELSMVRGCIMDELQKRNPEAFDKWLDLDYPDNESLKKLYLNA